MNLVFRSHRLGTLLLIVSATAAAEEAPRATSVKELAAKVRPSIVVVTFAGREGSQQGLGTGFVIDRSGLIATNLHVIGEARPISVQTADGKTLAVGDSNHHVTVWDVETGKRKHSFQAYECSSVAGVAFMNGGKRLVTTSSGEIIDRKADSEVKVWKLE